MIKIVILKKKEKICEYQIKGHSGYAERGNDIVCSAVSTAGQMALVGLVEVLNLKVSSDIKDGYMHVCLEDFENENAQTILKAMGKTLGEIAKEYDKFVRMEVRDVC